MSMEQILETVRAFDGILELAPGEGSDFPELAWGDHFFYYAPDGLVPGNEQPYATIITKDYPEDTLSHLDAEDRWRVNIHVGSARAAEVTGPGDRWDFAAADVIVPHPVYGSLGWVSVVNPGEGTMETVLSLMAEAHADARRRYERRTGRG